MTKQVKAIELLEVVTEVKIPKDQRNQKFKGTSKAIRKAIVAVLEGYKENTEESGGNVDAAKKLIQDYKDNKVTNYQIADIVKKSFVTDFKTMMTDAFPMDSMEDEAKDFIVDIIDGSTDKYLTELVKKKHVKDVDQALIIEKIMNDLVASDKFKKKFNGLTINEIIYGKEIKPGVGYDHLLTMNISQLQRYETVASV